MSDIMQNMLYLNGQFIPREDAKISVFDYGFLFGAGVYDVALAYDGMLFQGSEHLDRFYKSAADIKVPIKETKEELIAICQKIVHMNALTDGIVYLQATHGSYGKRSHVFPANMSNPTLMIFTQPLAPYPDSFFTEGVELTSEPEYRWTRCNIKAIGLLPAVLTMNSLPAGTTEAVFYDEEKKTVRECAASNIFCVKDGVIITPPLSKYILPGIERQTTVNIARQNNLSIKEEDFTIDFLKSADEVFMTSTTKEVLPVRKIDDTVVQNTPGPVTRKLMGLFVDYVEKQTGLSHPKRKLGLF